MARATETIGFSVPSSIARQFEHLAKAEQRIKSELFRERVRVYERHREQCEEFDEEWALNVMREGQEEERLHPMSPQEGNSTMPRIHDRGGWPDAGPINTAEHDLAMWEKRTDALLVLLSSPDTKLIRVDELRRAIESLPSDAYEKLSYYERWITAIETIMLEKGVFSKEEVEQKIQELEAAGS